MAASLELAARAIAIGVAANTALKLLLALAFSSGSFRRIAGGTLAAMLCAAVAWLALQSGIGIFPIVRDSQQLQPTNR